MLALSTLCFSQNTQQVPEEDQPAEATSENGRNGFWEARMQGGNYVVALGRISSVSRHKYLLNGTLIVDEVTVDTNGQALARFYFISPVSVGGQGSAAAALVDRAAELTEVAKSRAGSLGIELQDMVVKEYPVTTHARTIEYRMLSKSQLDVLFQSVKTAWQDGKGRVFTAL